MPLLTLTVLLVLYLLSGMMNAWAEVPESWKTTPYVIAADPVPLRQALKEMQAALGVRMEISPGVSGTVRGAGQSQTVQGFLDALAQRQSLTWFYFQDRLYVSTLGETASARLRLDAGRAQDVKSYLTAIHLLDDRYVWLPLATAGEVLVEGPPAYVDLVTQKARNVPSAPPAPAARPAEQPELMTFRVWYARAADDDAAPTFPGLPSLPALSGIGGGRPGIATLLNRLFNPGMNGIGGLAGLGGLGGLGNPQRNIYMELERNKEELIAQRQAGWPALRPAVGGAATSGTFLDGGGPPAAGNGTDPTAWPTAPGMGSGTGTGTGTGMGTASSLNLWSVRAPYDKPEDSVVFEADPRTNMVMVRAKPSMRRQIEAALAALDVPLNQIELETVVFDLPLSTMRAVLRDVADAGSAAVSGTAGGVSRSFMERATAQAVLNRIAAVRQGDSSFGMLHQSLVFAEDEKFDLDFDDQLKLPTYSTTIWEGMIGRLVPLKQRQDSPRQIGMKIGGTARVLPQRGVRLSLELSESRATPNLAEKTVSSQNTSSSLSVSLADAQVLMLMDNTVWSGEDMSEPRVLIMFLGARSQADGRAPP